MESNHYAGNWLRIVNGETMGKLQIFFEGEVCSTQRIDFKSALNYQGVGLLYKRELFLSEVLQTNSNDVLGGVCIYTPIPMTSTFYAYWTSFRIFPSLGSGFAVKNSVTPKFFDGDFSINYYDAKQKKFTPFNLSITEVSHSPDLKTLAWNGLNKLCGVGLKLHDFLSLAWGTDNKNWQIKSCSLLSQDEMEIISASLPNPHKTKEVLVRE